MPGPNIESVIVHEKVPIIVNSDGEELEFIRHQYRVFTDDDGTPLYEGDGVTPRYFADVTTTDLWGQDYEDIREEFEQQRAMLGTKPEELDIYDYLTKVLDQLDTLEEL